MPKGSSKNEQAQQHAPRQEQDVLTFNRLSVLQRVGALVDQPEGHPVACRLASDLNFFPMRQSSLLSVAGRISVCNFTAVVLPDSKYRGIWWPDEGGKAKAV